MACGTPGTRGSSPATGPRGHGAKVERPRDAGRTPVSLVLRERTAKARPPGSGGFFPGDRGSFSERDTRDRYPAYTVATATKGTSDC